MNVGEVAVKNAPTVYLCMSSDKDVIAKADKEVPWGYEAIGKRIQLSESSSGPEQAELVQHFLKLKERDGFYGILPASLTVTPGTDGACSVTGKLELPAKIPPGEYDVRLYSVIGKQITSNQTGRLHVATKGFPALLVDLAMKHSLAYGLLAVVIAIVAGFATGYFFTSKGAH